MARRTNAQRAAGVCTTGKHQWIEGNWRCSECEREYKQKQENKEKANALRRNSESKEVQRISRFKRTYGVDPCDIPDLCEVCGDANGRGKGIVVDHNHETEQVRGFLCSNCNTALGLVKDDPARLEKLALYLRERK